MRANTITILALATGVLAAPQHGDQYSVSSSTPCETPTSQYETPSSSQYNTPTPTSTPCEETPVPTTTPCDTPVPTTVVVPPTGGNWTEPPQHTGPVVLPPNAAAAQAIPVLGSLAAVAMVNALFL